MSGSTTNSFGIMDLLWGGTKLAVDTKGSSFSPGGLVSTAVVTGRTITSAQQVMAPSIKASFALTKGMSLNAIRALNNSEMQVICDSGQTFIVQGAFLTKDLMVKAGAGANVSAEWSGQPASESLA
jgi:hypothetical protein